MKETNLIYKPVEITSPYQANRLGVLTDRPIFLEPDSRVLSVLGKLVGRPSVYQPGSTVEHSCPPYQEGQRIFGFPELQTAIVYESIGYFGFAPFTGFIAVGEAMGEYVIEPIGGFSDLCVRAEKMRVLGIKAFIEEREVREGNIVQFNDLYIPGSYLTIEHGNSSPGVIKYSFCVSQKGEIEFREI